MNTKTDWIKMTDRRPTEQDLPILLWNDRVPKAKYCSTNNVLRCQLGLTCFSHWMPAPEPPREETQYDKDRAAFQSTQRYGIENAPWYTWHAALAYERAEVAKMLPPERSDLSNWDTVAHAAYASTKAIRARCAGGGQQ